MNLLKGIGAKSLQKARCQSPEKTMTSLSDSPPDPSTGPRARGHESSLRVQGVLVTNSFAKAKSSSGFRSETIQ